MEKHQKNTSQRRLRATFLVGAMIFISLFMMSFISGIEYTENAHGVSQVTEQGTSPYGHGVTGLLRNASINLIIIEKPASATTTNCSINYINKTTIAWGTFVGRNCSIILTQPLTNNTYYWFMVWGGEPMRSKTASFPYVLPDITLNQSSGDYGMDAPIQTTQIQGVRRIWTGVNLSLPETNINITLNTPINNSVISTSSTNLNTTLNITGTNYSYQWKNITYKVWFSNGTEFNSTLQTGLTGNYTSSQINMSGLFLGNYIWNAYACYGNTTASGCNWSDIGNYSFGVGLATSSVIYNSSTIPTAVETFLLQGIKTTFTSSVSANFIYGGISYPSTVTMDGNNVNITNSITILSNASGNITFYWNITSFGTLGSITQNSSSYNQTVGNLSIYACTSPPSDGLTLNFTLYDESSKAKINGSLESTFNYFAFGGSGASTQTYNFQSINKSKSNWMFCINSSGYNVSFSGTASYYADYYDRREYIFSNATIGNFTQNIPLYLSLIADTDVVTVTVQDQNYNPISGALVYIQEWNVGTNTYSTIGMFYTDSNGNGIINLELYNKWYRAVVSVDGEIVKTTDVQKLADTTWFINVELATANPYELFDSISHGLTFDNETNITTFVWTDGSGYIQSGCLYIYNNTNTGYSLIHSECVSSVAGIINYLLPGDGDYQLVGTVYLTPDYNVSKVTDVLFVQIGVPELTRIISPFGKILTFLFVGVATFLGVSVGSPIWGSMLLIGSLFLTFKLGWIKLSSAILWGLLSVVIVIIFRQKRRVG